MKHPKMFHWSSRGRLNTEYGFTTGMEGLEGPFKDISFSSRHFDLG